MTLTLGGLCLFALDARSSSNRATSEASRREVRTGFELGLALERVAKANPKLKGIVMGQHGLINWADGNKECYDLTLRLIEQAAGFIEKRARQPVDVQRSDGTADDCANAHTEFRFAAYRGAGANQPRHHRWMIEITDIEMA